MEKATAEYVMCFIFDEDRKHILLLQKKRPEYLANLWQGPGGKCEPGESIRQAATREFVEETQLVIPEEEWMYKGLFHNSPKWVIHLFAAVVSYDFMSSAKANTDEPLMVCSLYSHHFNDIVVNPELNIPLNPSIEQILNTIVSPVHNTVTTGLDTDWLARECYRLKHGDLTGMFEVFEFKCKDENGSGDNRINTYHVVGRNCEEARYALMTSIYPDKVEFVSSADLSHTNQNQEEKEWMKL